MHVVIWIYVCSIYFFKKFIYLFIYLFIVFLAISWAAPAAYGGSQEGFMKNADNMK